MKFKVYSKIFEKFPGVQVGVLVVLGMNNTKGTKEIAKLLIEEEEKKQKELASVDLKDHSQIAPWREAYRQFGSKPRKYRSSVEALLRRVQSGARLPSINPLVDLYNYLSIKHFLPAGAEDLDKVKGDIQLTFAEGTEAGKYIGAKEVNTCYEGEVIYKDNLGFVCRRWNWREAERTKIDEESKNTALVLEALPVVSDKKFQEALDEAQNLIEKFLGGKVILKILTKKNPILEVDFETGKKAEKEEIERKEEKKIKEKSKVGPIKRIADEWVDKSGISYKLQEAVWKAAKQFDESLKIRDIHLEHPAVLKHGDYATNIALKLAKTKEGKCWHSPLELAKEIAKQVQSYTQDYAKVTVAKPGFINFTLTHKALLDLLIRVNEPTDNFGRSDWGKDKTVVIDYSAPNIAKPFGVGHLRSTIIGQALYNIYQFLGWKCIGDNHIGDWGTQFGKLIYMIKRESLNPQKLSLEDLEKLYIQFHKEVEKNPKLMEEGREWFKKLEEKDLVARKIWKACVNLSLKEFERIYNLLQVEIDYTLGESFYEDKMGEVINEVKEKGIAKKSAGALIMEIPELKTPLMLLKSDGATTYETRDLATIKYRLKTWNPDLYIYEVGAEQKLHFQKVFGAAVLLGYGKREQFVHVAHGLILDKTGKFSTRKGTTIHLEDVLKEAVDRAKKVAKKAGISKGLSKKQQADVAKAVGIGAIKYNDLKQSPEKDVVFAWEKILALEGDSGPYLQYTHARARSVLRKSQISNLKFQTNLKSQISNSKLNLEELSILRTLYKFPEVVEEAGKNYAPNLICNFLFDLAQKFNLFYNLHPILRPKVRGQRSEVKGFRLALTSATAQVLKNGLTLLGIEPLERM